ncbi:hypothetical protein ACPV47_13165 [Vibrio jasicida]|jgi:hypothetical protein|uniref:hypothetical protein n=1 Tax=Vibrio jasicida TaxID=766224 RepID=UPI0040695025
MSDNYYLMIQDFFKVYEALERYVMNHYEEGAVWDTQLVRLDIDHGAQESSYDLAQAAKMLALTEGQVKSFFVVYSFLSHNLYDLIGNRDHEDWSSDGNNLLVEYSDLTIETFSAEQIAPLMVRRAYFEWTYEALQQSYDKLNEFSHTRIA